jgi:hypothetical protein
MNFYAYLAIKTTRVEHKKYHIVQEKNIPIIADLSMQHISLAQFSTLKSAALLGTFSLVYGILHSESLLVHSADETVVTSPAAFTVSTEAGALIYF